jgi:hypothetical protein
MRWPDGGWRGAGKYCAAALRWSKNDTAGRIWFSARGALDFVVIPSVAASFALAATAGLFT